MKSGVFISLSPEYPYNFVSTGDFVNPITETFFITGEGGLLRKVVPLYLVIHNVFIRNIRIEPTINIVGINLKFSRDNVNYNEVLNISENINAENRTIIIPFYLMIEVQNEVGLYPPSQVVNINNIKLRLIVA